MIKNKLITKLMLIFLLALTACGKGKVVDNISKNMVLVQGGTFKMGTNDGNSNEKPIHSVTLDSFYIGKYEVTQAEFEAVMGFNPSKFDGGRNPVEYVTWYDAVMFCNELSKHEGLKPYYSISGIGKNSDGNITKAKVSIVSGNGYRLPTEAEWEYAARGGNKSKGYKYSGSDNIGSVAWYRDNSGSKTHPVGTKASNELGIYDMSGNVYEWCWDWYGSSYYSSSPSSNPAGPFSGSYRVERGGGWISYASGCRVANRRDGSPSDSGNNVGFRPARSK